MNKPLAFPYVRMSTDAQFEGDSLRRQVTASQKYAEENGLELVNEAKLHDIGVSAFNGANIKFGELGKFLGAVNEGKSPKDHIYL